MVFATTGLAAEIERAECELLTESAEAILAARPDADTAIHEVCGGVAIYAGKASPLNKVAGLGFAGPFNTKELEVVEALYGNRGSPVQIELASLADPSIAPLLTDRGYSLVGFENVLGRELTPRRDSPEEPGSDSTIDVRPAGDDPADLEVWLDTVVDGFAAPDEAGVPAHESFPREALEQVMRDMAGGENLVRYLARLCDEPAGGGSMRVGERIVQLCGAATLPAHRRRGVQTALLERRLFDAARSGCDLAVVTTLPGSKSQENVQRKGFVLLYTRAVLVRPPAQP